MTKISPKPTEPNITNGHNEANNDSDASGFFKSAVVSSTSQPTKFNSQSTVSDKSTVRVMPKGMKNLSWWQRTSLRTKVTLGAIAFGIIPLLAVGVVDYATSSRNLRQNATDGQESIAISLGDQVGNFMFERYGDVQVLANLPILANPKVRAVTTSQEKQKVLDRFAKIYGVYDSIAVGDLAGNTILQSSGEPVTGLGERDYFKEVIKTKRPVITPPRKSALTGKYSIFLAAPIVDTNTGNVIGMVRTRVPVENLDKIVQAEEARLAEGIKSAAFEEYHVIGPDGKFFVAKEKEQIGRDAREDFPPFAGMEAAKKVTSAITVDKIDNAEQLISYVPVNQAEGLPQLNWSIVLAEDTSVIFAEQRRLLLTLLIGTGLTALLVGAIAAYIARRATRPILEATATVEKLGRGEFDNRIQVSGGDEIAVLGSNINRMADTVQELLRQQELETEQTRLFADIASSRVDKAQDLDVVFDQALAGAKEILNADRVVIYRFKPDFSGYIANEAVSPGFPQALNDKIEDPCISDELIEAYKKGRVVPTNNVFEAGFHPDHLALMERLQIRANLVTPIINNKELYGLLIAHHCTATHDWQQTEITFLEQMSERLGAILSRVSFLEQKEAEATRSALLKDITANIGQSLDSADIYNKSVQEARRAIKSDRVVIYSFNDKWQGTVTAESVGEGFPKAMGAKIDDPCFANKYVERYKGGRVQATNDIYKAGLTDCYLNQLSIFAVRANLVAPILRGDELLGLLIAHHCSGPRNWEQADMDLFSQLATQVGFALERAKLLDQQKVAKEFLQRRALELLIEVDPLSRGDLTIRANVT